MAFQIVQTFEDAQYEYDRTSDVLDVSFGAPRPAVAFQIEDWLAVRFSPNPPQFFVGMTIVGFKKILEMANRYVKQELPDVEQREVPERMERLASAKLSISYDDQTDTMIMRVTDLFDARPAIFEQLMPNVYIEKSLPSKDVLGVKIFNYTKQGPEAIEAMLGRIVDTVFEPDRSREEGARLITNAVMRHVDWNRLAARVAA